MVRGHAVGQALAAKADLVEGDIRGRAINSDLQSPSIVSPPARTDCNNTHGSWHGLFSDDHGLNPSTELEIWDINESINLLAGLACSGLDLGKEPDDTNAYRKGGTVSALVRIRSLRHGGNAWKCEEDCC